MQTTLINLLQDLLYAVIICATPIITKYICNYLQTKKEDITTGINQGKFDNTLCKTIELINDTVNMISQTFVDTLKKEGKFDETAQKEAFNQALNTVKGLLDNETKDLLETVYNDLDSWLKVQIEACVKDNK